MLCFGLLAFASYLSVTLTCLQSLFFLTRAFTIIHNKTGNTPQHTWAEETDTPHSARRRCSELLREVANLQAGAEAHGNGREE